ncbi:acyltransferase family protein [Tabrizicola aquatica]|uniref:acyltransferase family protein n=1 Tax=Tabrizicola aquatica TaxID=909926 RepID=UPI000CD2B240|nr:acyltransferase [Tabrizicola aquatica]
MTMSNPAAPPGIPHQQRRAQIDGLRALAMVGVLYVHLYDKSPQTEGLRVALFFVVSGFLITHILYTAKERGGHIHVLNFYIRRALRLFPALAILVGMASIFDIDGFRQEALWHLAQLSNVRFMLLEAYKPWVVSHLWSLNILEQFYLIWPIVILFLPLHRIYVVTLVLIVGLTFAFANADALGIGGWGKQLVLSGGPVAFGAFAYLLQRHGRVRDVVCTPLAVTTSLAVIFAPFVAWEGFGNSDSYRLLTMPALSVIVVGAFAGFRGPVGWVLGSAPARFASQISYGVYMYHLLVWWAVGETFPHLYQPNFQTFLIITALTVVAATLSWYLIEEPISRLKRHFPTATREHTGQDRSGGLSADATKRPA